MTVPDEEQRAALRMAYECVSEVYAARREASSQSTSSEDKGMSVLSSIIGETIYCIQNDTPIDVNHLSRLSKLIFRESQSDIVKLAFSLSILLRKLMTDRDAVKYSSSNRAGRSHSANASTPILRGLLGEGPSDDNDQASTYSESYISISQRSSGADPDVEEIYFDFEDVKPFEQPIADVYCPITGESRPFDELRLHEEVYYPIAGESRSIDESSLYEENCTEFADESDPSAIDVTIASIAALVSPLVHSEEPCMPEVQSISAVPSLPELPLTLEPCRKKARIRELQKRRYNKEKAKMNEISNRKLAGSMPSQVCHLCLEVTSEYFTTPRDQLQRTQFLANIIKRSDLDEIILSTLREGSDPAHFCATHFDPAGIARFIISTTRDPLYELPPPGCSNSTL